MPYLTLYIIGNGFDRFHGMPSGYGHFKDYVAEHDTDLFNALEKYFNVDELWSDFENTLAYLDIETIRDEAMNYLVDYASDEWSDADNHNYQYEINERVRLISERLLQHFREWVLTIPLPAPGDQRLYLSRDSYFLNFNYTATLQIAYGIPEDRILHIHNKSVDKNSDLILGHGWKPSPTNQNDGDEESDPRIVEGERILNGYFSDTYKPTDQVLHDRASFFNDLQSVKDIYIFGHSMADVDGPYFAAVAKVVDMREVTWHSNYFGDADAKAERENILLALGIPASKIILKKLEEFNEDPSQLRLI
jgi:hypothetical protein